MSINVYSGQALITFSYDDGRRNNYDTALPLHEKYDIAATFAIIAGRLAGEEWSKRHMTAFEVADSARRGIEIASHSMTHKERFPELNNEDLRHEIVSSKRALEALTPRQCLVNAICVPFSKIDERVASVASETYDYIRVDGKRYNDVATAGPVVFSHPIRNDTTPGEIQGWIDKAVSSRKWLVLMFHGIVAGEGSLPKYDASAETLRQTLEHVNSYSRDVLLPVTFSQASSIARQAKGKTSVEESSPTTFLEQVPRVRPGRQTVVESENYLITYHQNENPSSKLVISFGGLPSGKTATGFGSSFILKQGWDHVFVAQAPMSQYQGLSLEDFERALSPIISGRKVFAYGSSLGAYAALYYGGIVNARIIAAAPKNSAHPLVLQKRFAHLDFNHRELADVPHSAAAPIVLYDPHRRDETRFINKLVVPAYPDGHYIKLDYAGHTVLDTMKQAGVLKSFITSVIDDGYVPAIALLEDGIPVFSAERGREKLLNGDAQGALEEFNYSLSIRFNSEAGAGRVKALLKLNRTHEARRALESYVANNGSHRGIPPWVQTAFSN